MQSKFWRLDSRQQTFILTSQNGKIPTVLYWGVKLPDNTNLSTLAKLTMVDLLAGGMDEIVDISICPNSLEGFYGHLGLEIFDKNKQPIAPLFVFDKDNVIKSQLIELWFVDKKLSLTYYASFKLHENSQIIEASAKIISKQKLYINWLAAPVISLPTNAEKLISFSGNWCAEFKINHFKFSPGSIVKDIKTGRSGHNAFAGLIAVEKNTNYNQGNAFGFHYGFSGGHKMIAEVLTDGKRQVQFGHASNYTPKLINQFQTASLFITYSDNGINGCATKFQQHVRKNLIHWSDKAKYSNKNRPIHYNCWEAVYFDHSEEKLFSLANKAAELGVERFVLDDGWFGKRDNDKSSLGDWYVHKKKYPNGLNGLIEHVNRLNMTFGLWVEPEMVNYDSELFRKHPQWVLGPVNQIKGRNQLVLNISMPVVREYLYESIARLLTEYNIEYLKWDHNRVLPFVDHDQTEGLYLLMNKIKTTFPGVEIESCASGGGRIDYGMLKYTHRFWMSDNNDAHERAIIQHNAALFLPAIVMGSHVGAKKSHYSGRMLDLNFRAWVSAQRHMGFELDLLQLSTDEIAEIKQVTSWWKKNRHWLMEADILKLDTFDDMLLAEEHLLEDKQKFMLFINHLGSTNQTAAKNLKLVNLDPNQDYCIQLINHGNAYLPVKNKISLKNEPLTTSGAVLMGNGINLPLMAPNNVLAIFGKSIS